MSKNLTFDEFLKLFKDSFVEHPWTNNYFDIDKLCKLFDGELFIVCGMDYPEPIIEVIFNNNDQSNYIKIKDLLDEIYSDKTMVSYFYLSLKCIMEEEQWNEEEDQKPNINTRYNIKEMYPVNPYLCP